MVQEHSVRRGSLGSREANKICFGEPRSDVKGIYFILLLKRPVPIILPRPGDLADVTNFTSCNASFCKR